jgi:putative peptidoglycan lipid II flippase
VLLFFLVGSFAFAANTIVPRAYYATQDTLFPAIYGSLAVLLSVPLYLLGLKMLGTRGVALAASLSAIFQVLLLYILWNRRSGNSGSRDVYRAYLKIIFISSALGILLIGFKQTVLGGVEANTFGGSMQIVLVIGIVFAVLLLLVGYIFRVKEIYETIRRFTTRPRGGHRTSE